LGDKKAFDSLVRKYQSSVRRFFLQQTGGDAPLSDDLAQDAFIKAYVSLKSFRGASSFHTWLMRIACNVFYDHVRRNSHESDADVSRAALLTAPEKSPALKLDLYQALRVVSEKERLCLTLQLSEGLSVEEIASATSIPLGTVKSHLSRGKQKMTEYLKTNGYE